MLEAGYLVVLNLAGYIAMGVDKGRAKRNAYRLSEQLLIGIAMVGGSLGVYWGMKQFHHKTKKPKFAVGVPVIVLMQILLVWYFYH